MCERNNGRQSSEVEKKKRVLYVYCITGKGNLQSWRNKLNSIMNSFYRFCKRHIETDKYIALVWLYREDMGPRWSNWEEMDKKKKYLKKVKDREKQYTMDLVETFFLNLNLYWSCFFLCSLLFVEFSVERLQKQGMAVDDFILRQSRSSIFLQFFALIYFNKLDVWTRIYFVVA